MAKYTAALLGQDTTTKLPPNFIPGFISDGNQATNAVSESLNQAITNEKKQKYEREQALMDGVISGHFSTEITKDVMDDIANLTGYNSNSKEYATALNKATAKLKVATQKQANVTSTLARGKDNYDTDEDSKYYKEENFFKFQEDSTNIELTNKAYANGYKKFLGNVDNVNQDLVREDYVDKIGKLVYGSSSVGEGEDIGDFKTMTQSVYNSEKTMFYKLKGGQSVPVFEKASDVPQELVDKWYTSGKANMAMMDSYVRDKLKGQSFTPEALKAFEVATRKEFINEQMKQVIPDYKSVSQKNANFQPGQNSGPKNQANSADITLTTLARAITGDDSIIGDRSQKEFNFENKVKKGFDITDQFQNINLYKLSGKESIPPTSVLSVPNEDALYVDLGDGKGTKKYGKSEFNMLVTMAAEADNGFSMTDANTSQYYNQGRGAFEIEQFYKDKSGKTKPASQMTPEDFSSGNWEPANKSLQGFDYRRRILNEDNTNEARANQLIAAKSLQTVPNFSFKDMATTKNTDQIKLYAKALNTSLVGKSVEKLGGGAIIKSIEKGNYLGSGSTNYVVYFSDGTEKQVLSGKDMAIILDGDVL